MSTRMKKNRGAFSLVELVIVIVIIGIIAAIAVPRISRGSAGAGAAALKADLHVLRNALDMYAAEHGGLYPTITDFVGQMTSYTDEGGTVSPTGTKDSTYKYGPYLAAVPVLKVGDGKGSDTVAATAAAGVGWVYDAAKGQISANGGLSAADASGKLFKDY